MLKNLFMMLIAGIFLIITSKLSFAMMCGGMDSGHSKHQEAAQAESSKKQIAAQASVREITQEAIDVGNKICPVSGEKIDEKTKATYEYEGKIYNFCCEMCIEEFKKDPQKYIKKVEEELQSESKGQSEYEGHEMEMMQESEASQQGMHQGHHH